MLFRSDKDKNVMNAAKHGECDVIITHCPTQEEELQRQNYTEGREEIMHDDYIILGPPSDPAGIRGTDGAQKALQKIADAKASFLLRNDGSGTYCKGEQLWSLVDVKEPGGWLKLSQEDMVGALRQASIYNAYTICDRSTFEANDNDPNLVLLLEGGEDLDNPYQVLIVNGLLYPDTDTKGAQKFKEYLLSKDAQRYFHLGVWERPSG